MKRIRMGALALAALLAATPGCTKKESKGKPDSTEIGHSSIKRQTIGNCWTYAVIGFIEAQEMRAKKLESAGPHEFSNYSESYLTYLHLEEAIANRELDSEGNVQTGGSFEHAMELTLSHGLMREGDFIPSEAESVASNRQSQAINYINASLKSGALKSDRSAATIHAELDKAFGITFEDVKAKVIPADQVKVIASDGTSVVTLPGYMMGPSAWSDNRIYLSSTGGARALAQVPYPGGSTGAARHLRAVKRSLNAGHPVLLSWLVEFNANDGGVFNAAILPDANYPRHNGYHLTALEDYTASGFDEETGLEFFVGEGPASDKAKKLAEDFGEIRALVTKNSWGSGFDRSDRAFYLRDGVPGYHRLEMNDYLLRYLWDTDKPDDSRLPILALTGFAYPIAMSR